ncbi:XRE family transcriptional regulator [Streptomyces johnsoniae]|uniref:XRE family transcriptional regulator n=1 Tax=Streptomyces johnsoniae TaxID=3075532 RepID=A0ABU2S3P4_9ACTN|nr:XRE family transcriptional regulator [Streptomyces sp. DSM 41886]MDT0443418.1 XRE family transcriptional regulator [Streptomyces sp. DSM 41886]
MPLPHRPSTTDSPLRRARLAVPATLERVCADLDRTSRGGSSGVTPSMLSGWERGRHTTSIRYRTLLSQYYGQAPDVLFAHQDLPLTAADQAPALLAGHRELRRAMTTVVRGAQRYLAMTGSRSRDTAYLETIETVLAERPELIHYRVLFGPPRNTELTAHLTRLLALRDPDDRSLGLKTLHLGVIPAERDSPERFFVASETAAVTPIPSLTSAYAFDSGVLLATHAAMGAPPSRQAGGGSSTTPASATPPPTASKHATPSTS